MQPSDLNPDEKNSLLTTLWNRSLIGVALVNRDGRFQRANPAFCSVVEYSEPELLRRRIHDITHPEDLQSSLSLTEDIAAGLRDSVVVKSRYITKTGRVVWAVLSIERLEVGGEFHYFVNQVSEVLTVNQMQVPVLIVKKPLFEPISKWIRENYPWVLVILGSVAYTLSEVLKRL